MFWQAVITCVNLDKFGLLHRAMSEKASSASTVSVPDATAATPHGKGSCQPMCYRRQDLALASDTDIARSAMRQEGLSEEGTLRLEFLLGQVLTRELHSQASWSKCGDFRCQIRKQNWYPDLVGRSSP